MIILPAIANLNSAKITDSGEYINQKTAEKSLLSFRRISVTGRQDLGNDDR
jgi:hypothetical protein